MCIGMGVICHAECQLQVALICAMSHATHANACDWFYVLSASCGKLQHMHCVNHTSLLWDVVWYTFCRCIYILVMMHVDACMPVTYMYNSLCFLMYNGCCDDSFHFIEFINRASSYWASHSSFILSGIGFIFIWKLDHMNLFMI